MKTQKKNETFLKKRLAENVNKEMLKIYCCCFILFSSP